MLAKRGSAYISDISLLFQISYLPQSLILLVDLLQHFVQNLEVAGYEQSSNIAANLDIQFIKGDHNHLPVMQVVRGGPSGLEVYKQRRLVASVQVIMQLS